MRFLCRHAVAVTLMYVVPGLFAVEGVAPLLDMKRYVVFLSRLDPDKPETAGTPIYRPGGGIEASFDPKIAFSIVRQGRIAVLIEEGDLELIKEIRRAATRIR